MNRPRAKGTMAESAVVAYLRENGWLFAERRSLKGSLDQGDVTGTPGLCWEVKYGDGGIRMSSWMLQTEVERINSNADYGILVIKPRGLGAKNTARWYAVMSQPSHQALIKEISTGFFVGTTEPLRYTAGILPAKLAETRKMLTGCLATAVTVMPPGAFESPALHYRVMYLEDAVKLLRAAGYGAPLSPGDSS